MSFRTSMLRRSGAVHVNVTLPDFGPPPHEGSGYAVWGWDYGVTTSGADVTSWEAAYYDESYYGTAPTLVAAGSGTYPDVAADGIHFTGPGRFLQGNVKPWPFPQPYPAGPGDGTAEYGFTFGTRVRLGQTFPTPGGEQYAFHASLFGASGVAFYIANVSTFAATAPGNARVWSGGGQALYSWANDGGSLAPNGGAAVMRQYNEVNYASRSYDGRFRWWRNTGPLDADGSGGMGGSDAPDPGTSPLLRVGWYTASNAGNNVIQSVGYWPTIQTQQEYYDCAAYLNDMY